MKHKRLKSISNQTNVEPPFFKPKIQPKLKTGKPGDKYEVEANKIADQVVNKTNTGDGVQKMDSEEEVQQKPIAESVTPLVQKMEGEEEAPVQKMEEEESVQTMEEGEAVQMEEEESVQMEEKNK